MTTQVDRAEVLAELALCRARLSAWAASGSVPSSAELTRMASALTTIEDQVRGVESPPTDTPTPATLRSLLLLARADLAEQLTEDASSSEQLLRVVQLAVRLVPGAEHAAVSLLRRGASIETSASTSPVAATCDRAQQELRDGPALYINGVHETIRIDDLSAEPRWPAFAARALDAGVRSMLVCELPAIRGAVGVLSLYSSRRRAFSPAGELVAPVFASRAAIAIAHADQVHNLRRAIGSRQVIGQAVGILMERHRLSADDAFERLVMVSQRAHIKLREVATRVTETGEDPEEITG